MKSSLEIVYGCSGMTIDPRISTTPGRCTSGFHRPGRHYFSKREAPWVCWASRMKGELDRTKNRCEADLKIDDSFNEFIYFPVWPLPETASYVGTT